ncbi:TULIP family P47-like protein [Yoonia sp. F2084L]|uniref:TULIP family P47-like protein n=1 Tax=Yoonia sp. F2084L TaxID=2926419 RepID=UPI001FF5C88E|nr:TULIP family P47-like protein [Yoonia sp. F2084L]MCK0094997.1 TULIP family P47-like protein [Yoonia sp. F2084L]
MTKHDLTLNDAANETTSPTNGWDTVFAIRFADVNNAISKAGSSPSDFSITEAAGSREVTISGPFEDWALIPGGDGQNAHMKLPVSALLLDDSADPDTPKTFNDVDVIIEVKFDFIPQPDRPSDGGLWHDLKILGPKPGAEGEDAIPVAVLDLEYDGGDMSGLQRGTIIGLLSDWLNDPDNLQEFNHVFASVNLNQKADVDAFQWMMPTHISYAVKDLMPADDGIFAVLCMTEGRSADGLAHEVSHNAIPVDERSSFLISKERFLSKMILPGAGHLFSGPLTQDANKVWPDDYFEIFDDETAIQNTAPLKIDQMDFSKHEDGSKCYEADIGTNDFVLRFAETYLDVSYTDLRHDYWHFGFLYNVFHKFNSRLAAKLDENQSFSLIPAPKDTLSTDFLHHQIVVKKTKGAQIVELVLLGISLFASAYSLFKVKWANVREIAMAETAGGAAGEMAASMEAAEATAEQMSNLRALGAADQIGWIKNGFLTAKAWFGAGLSAIGANIIASVCGGLVSFMEILQIVAGFDSETELPRFDFFAAKIMAPIQWPEASDYEVTMIQFNGSFQVTGNAGFAWDKVSS